MIPFLKNKKKKNDNTSKKNNSYKKMTISKDLIENVNYIKELFSYPTNTALMIHELSIAALDKKAYIFFIDGMVNETEILQHVLHPLAEDLSDLIDQDAILKNILKASQLKKVSEFSTAVDDLLIGNTLLFIEETGEAISLDTTTVEHRNIEKPIRENLLRGPQEGFVESLQVNLSLIRKRLRDENLITKVMSIGKRSISTVNILYIKNIANPDFIKEVKKRIKNIKVDSINSIEILEQHLEEHSYSLLPTMLYTERPDRATAFLMEGYVVLLMDSSSDCLILPVTFWSLFQSPEDMYLRWPYGNFIRLLRLFALFSALLTPAIYIAITTFHAEMVPTDLLMAIAATRERVPFPVIIEVILMEGAFELVREAGTRIPSSLGSTIGVVGALILGQAAVQANIVSPILVIIVSITGLSSFALPDNSLSFIVRIARFGFLVLGSILGAYGIVIGLSICLGYMTSFESFGVPFLSPLAPYHPSSNDTVFRPPVWKQWLRPFSLKPKEPIRESPPDKKGEK